MAKLIKFPIDNSKVYDIFPPRMQYALDEMLDQNKQFFLKEGRVQGFWAGWLVCCVIMLCINLFVR